MHLPTSSYGLELVERSKSHGTTMEPHFDARHYFHQVANHYAPWHPFPNETQVLANAKALLTTGNYKSDRYHGYGSLFDPTSHAGLSDVGFVHVNLDCGYSSGYRDPKTKKLVAEKTLFPSGIPSLSAEIRSLKKDKQQDGALKFGIYTSGRQCCSPKDADDGNIGYEVRR